MKKKKVKKKGYIIEVILEQKFSSYKDVEASSEEEAKQLATEVAVKEFNSKVRGEYWTREGTPIVLDTVVIDEEI